MSFWWDGDTTEDTEEERGFRVESFGAEKGQRRAAESAETTKRRADPPFAKGAKDGLPAKAAAAVAMTQERAPV
jgi:hypothetical protein